MYDGGVVQVGTPVELFNRPKHTFVGYFIGSPGMNILPCGLDNGLPVFGNQRLDSSYGGAGRQLAASSKSASAPSSSALPTTASRSPSTRSRTSAATRW